MNRVRHNVFQRFGILTVLTFAAFLNGCATVVMNGDTAKAVSAERDALKTAAAEVADVSWPKPQAASMSERLTGIVAGPKKERITKKQAIEIYVASLEQTPNPQAALIEDAEIQLRAADVLTAAAEDAATATRPAMADVAIVEGAISELRQAKEIYLASLDLVAADDPAVDNVKRGLKTDFNRAIKEIGAAADVLADRVAEDRTKTMAQPTVGRMNFSGSL